jgi:hypothetical protein
LVDVTFGPPGGTATGTFTTNDAITALLTYDITTSSVTGFPGFEYTPATAPIVLDSLPSSFVVEDSVGSSANQELGLFFAGGLTATDAALSTTAGSRSLEVSTRSETITRFVASGSVVGVPEPSALVLGGLAAAAGLGLWAWRRRVASSVG